MHKVIRKYLPYLLVCRNKIVDIQLLLEKDEVKCVYTFYVLFM